MGNISTKHRGGFSATKPSTGPGGHPEQKPGDAMARPDAKMSFREKGLDATTTAHAKRGSSKE